MHTVLCSQKIHLSMLVPYSFSHAMESLMMRTFNPAIKYFPMCNTNLNVLVFCAIFPCDNHPGTTVPISSSASNLRSGRLLTYNNFENENPIVRTKSGPVEGYVAKTISNRHFYAFEGIPYAETTAGVNRFQPPIPKAPWTGVFKAKRSDIKCLQNIFIVTGQEDCLVLSIYTPQISNKAEKLPVILFIHGGAFRIGYGGEYGPYYLLDENVIFVTVNYRLGVLGFLSTGDEVVPGNNGLKDQALAIKWIFQNIDAFGGDSKRITLMGHSAGAVSVHCHILSNMTRGYFSGAYALSGSAFSTWGVHSPKVVENRKVRLAHVTGCPLSGGSHDFVDCLRNLNPYLLIGSQRWMRDMFLLPVLFAPVIEPWSNNAFLSKTPEEHYRKGDISKVPLLTTMVKHEANAFFALYKAFMLYRRYLREYKQKVPIVLDYALENEGRQAEITEKISHFYLKDEDISLQEETLEEMMTDRMYAVPNRMSIQAHSSLAPVYTYIFNVSTKKSFSYFLGQDPEKMGSVHGDDFFFMLNFTRVFENWKKTDREYPLVQFMCNMIANFAATGVPDWKKDNKLVRIWEPVTDSKNIRFLQISHDIKMIDDPFKERMQFWEDLNMTDMKPWFPKNETELKN